MQSTDQRPNYSSRLQSNFVDTTDRCVELYFWMDSPETVDQPVLSVVAVSEEYEETVAAKTFGRRLPGWNRLFAELPDGINRIVIEGRRGTAGFTGIAVDDIFVQECEKFSEQNGTSSDCLFRL